MINVELLRETPDVVRESISKRGGDVVLVDNFTAADANWKQLTSQAEALRAERNSLTTTKELAMANTDKLAQLKEQLATLEQEEKAAAAKRQELLYQIPQLIDQDVPVGPGESANTVIKTVGTPTLATGKAHDELMAKNGWLNIETAARFSGSRFRYLTGQAALAEMQLMQLAMKFAVSKGFTPVIPPVLVNDELLTKGGFFPTGRDEVYATDELFLAGTSEPTLVALAANQTIRSGEQPLRFVGFSSCFRKEAGTYGKDTQGMFRQHQFDKVEMVSICSPEQSKDEHEFLLKMEEEFIALFGLAYQVVLIGSGDLEVKAKRRYDLETWFPGQERYRETHSVSNCGDYQARRFGIKAANQDGTEVFAHTLNGTLATERLLLAIIENNQQADGSIRWPEQLA